MKSKSSMVKIRQLLTFRSVSLWQTRMHTRPSVTGKTISNRSSSRTKLSRYLAAATSRLTWDLKPSRPTILMTNHNLIERNRRPSGICQFWTIKKMTVALNMKWIVTWMSSNVCTQCWKPEDYVLISRWTSTSMSICSFAQLYRKWSKIFFRLLLPTQ